MAAALDNPHLKFMSIRALHQHINIIIGLHNNGIGHLSENNNTRELAYECSLEALQELGVEKGTVALRCLPRQYPSQMYML